MLLRLPAGFPKAPNPFVAALLSPFAWTYGRPDLFDSYSCGILLMQMCVPQLRSTANIRQFNNQLRSFDQVGCPVVGSLALGHLGDGVRCLCC
jgi:hypothetical protein